MASANTFNEGLGLYKVIDGVVTEQPLLSGFSLPLSKLFALGAKDAVN